MATFVFSPFNWDKREWRFMYWGGRPHENRFKWKKNNINPTFFNSDENYCTFSKSMVYKLVK